MKSDKQTTYVNIADALACQGYAYYILNKNEEGIQVINKSIDYYLKVYNEQHKDIADALENLGHLYLNSNKIPDADLHYNKSLNIRINLCGLDHPLVGLSY